MKTRVRELCEMGSRLFTKRERVTSLWQETARQFYPERADFTATLDPGDEFAAHLMTGAPAMFRRDLANNLSAMLRPRDKPWFRARTHDDKINDDAGSKAFLDHLSEHMRKVMYAKSSQFVRSTKQGDNDFATFGQCVISIDPSPDLNGLLYRTWHLRDTVWCESPELVINRVDRNWTLEAVGLDKLFKGKVAGPVKTCLKKEPYKEVKCRHIILPADQYDYTPTDKKSYGSQRKLPFISIYVDIENEFILEEKPVKRINYVIPRWATVSGSQYAHSPATVIALPDARLLQQITLTLLEAGQKVVDPPSVGSKEAIQGPVQLFAGGHTWVDSEYDEKTGDALRYLPIDAKGLSWGGEREAIVMQAIKEALYLNQIDVPYPKGDMTATEYQGRVRDYIIRALPLFEPMEVEYNGGLCEDTYELMHDMNGFGSMFEDMPDTLRNQDIRWTFESPLQAATERAKAQAFIQTSELLKIAAEADPNAIHDIDVSKAFRDAVTGTGAPADWIVPEDQAKKVKEAAAKQAASEAEMAQMAQGADVAARAGDAAQSMGLGAEGLRNAGLV